MKTPRDYQKTAAEHLNAHNPALVVLPTGAGKTLVLALATAASTRPCVLVISPRENVLDDLTAEVLDPPLAWKPIGYGQPFPVSPGYYLMSHAAFANFLAYQEVPADMKDWLVLFDEFHHVAESANNTGEMMARILRGGAAVGGVTATPDRADLHALLHQDVHAYSVPYSSLADQFGFPTEITFEVVHLCGGDLRNCVWSLFEADPRPTVVHLRAPGVQEGEVQDTADAILEVKPPGVRAFNAVGTGARDPFRALLERERDVRHYDDRSMDVIVSCRRMGEGSNWPVCANVILVGLPDSFPAAVQAIGRAMRPKHGIEGFPDPERVRVTVIVNAGVELVQVDRTCLLLQAHFELTPGLRMFERVWQETVLRLRLPPAVRPRVAQGLHPDDVEKLSEARVWLYSLASAHPGMDASAVIRICRYGLIDDKDTAFAVVREILLANPQIEQHLHRSLPHVVRRALADSRFEQNPRVVVRDAILDMFYGIAEELAGELTIPTPTGWASTLTPERMRSAAVAVRDLRRRILDQLGDSLAEVVDHVLEPYRKHHGRLPSIVQGSQDLTPFVGFKLGIPDLDQLLRERCGTTLSKLCLAVGPGSKLDPIEVRASWAALRPQRRAEILRAVDRPVWDPGLFRITIGGSREVWPCIVLASRYGIRGLSPDLLPTY